MSEYTACRDAFKRARNRWRRSVKRTKRAQATFDAIDSRDPDLAVARGVARAWLKDTQLMLTNDDTTRIWAHIVFERNHPRRSRFTRKS